MATETRHIISNVNSLWGASLYTGMDNVVESPSGPVANGITAEGNADDNEDQQYNLAQPSFSGYKFITAVKIWCYATSLDRFPTIRVKISGIIYGGFSPNFNVWSSQTVSGLWVASNFASGWVMSALSPNLDKHDAITIKAMYAELTTQIGTTNLRGGNFRGGNYGNT